MNKPTYEELAAAFCDAMDHLDWTGWGDKWERECIEDDGTRARLEDVHKRLTEGVERGPDGAARPREDK